MQTEYAFTLPRGYVDEQGQVHREGRMRLARAIDEVEPLTDPRVVANEAYLAVLLLSRVVTQLGKLPCVTPEVIEQLFSVDLAHLQDLYQQVNERPSPQGETVCPACQHRFTAKVALGE